MQNCTQQIVITIAFKYKDTYMLEGTSKNQHISKTLGYYTNTLEYCFHTESSSAQLSFLIIKIVQNISN